MPLDYVPVVVVRSQRVHLGGGDYDETEGQVPGSPFLARVYRAAQNQFDRDEAASGNASVDRMPRLSVRDPLCPIREGDVALLPQPGGGTRRASVLLVRPYGDRIQCDLEMGAEGDAAGAPGPLLTPPSPTAQAQIDALTTQLGDLMTYIKSTPAATRLQVLTTQQSGSTLAAPLTVPPANIDQVIVSRTLSAAATDFLFSASQSGRALIMAFSNAIGSTANLTLSAQTNETIAGPATALNPAVAQTYVLQPGESLTLANTGAAAWTQVE